MASNNAASKNSNPNKLTSEGGADEPNFKAREPDSSLCCACGRHLIFHRFKPEDPLPDAGKIDRLLCLAAAAAISSIAPLPPKPPKQPTKVAVQQPRQQSPPTPPRTLVRPVIGEDNMPQKKRKVDLKDWTAANNPSGE